MQHITDILPKVTANSLAVNNRLIVENAIAMSKVTVNPLLYSLVCQVPTTKLSKTKLHIHKIIKPCSGYNGSLSNRNWLDPKANRWYPEPTPQLCKRPPQWLNPWEKVRSRSKFLPRISC